jgi:hypothetical protein
MKQAHVKLIALITVIAFGITIVSAIFIPLFMGR